MTYEVLSYVNPMTFEYWSGAKSTVKYLTLDELEKIWSYITDCGSVTLMETEINDFFWFETDAIAEILGYKNFDELMEDRTSEFKLGETV